MARTTFDLSSAYRQVTLSDAGRRHAYIRTFNPNTGAWSVFQAAVLRFGAVKSVHAFLRLARALWWLGVVGCYLATCLVIVLWLLQSFLSTELGCKCGTVCSGSFQIAGMGLR